MMLSNGCLSYLFLEKRQMVASLIDGKTGFTMAMVSG